MLVLVAACNHDGKDSKRRPECVRYEAESRARSLSWPTAVGLLNCGQETAGAVAALWTRPPSDSAGLTNLIAASTGVLNRKILVAATPKSTDRSQLPNVRAAAVIVMGRYVNGRLGAVMPLDRWRSRPPLWGPQPGLGLEPPLDTTAFVNDRAAIIRRITRVSRDDPDEMVRDLATVVLRFLTDPPR